jgi:hypothetical protein
LAKRLQMDVLNLWLPLIGAGILGAIAVSAWFAGQRSVGIWFGFAGTICLLLLVALQAQDFVNRQDATPVQVINAQNRAYVNVSTAELTRFQPGDWVQAVIRVKNFGQTPASNVRIWQYVDVKPYPYPKNIEFDPDNGKHPARPLPPGDDFAAPVIWDVAQMNQTTINAFRAGTYALYVVGTIAYDDAAGRPHTTKYCLYAGGMTRLWDGTLATYKEGNEAD